MLVVGAPSASATGFLESLAVYNLVKQGIRTTSNVLRNTTRFLKEELGRDKGRLGRSGKQDYAATQETYEKFKRQSINNMYERDEKSRERFQRDIKGYGDSWKQLGRNVEHDYKMTMDDYERQYKQRSEEFQSRVKKSRQEFDTKEYSRMRGREFNDGGSRKRTVRGFSKQSFVRGKR